MKMITVENLSFLYRKSKRAVLHDFSLSLEKECPQINIDIHFKIVQANLHYSI